MMPLINKEDCAQLRVDFDVALPAQEELTELSPAKLMKTLKTAMADSQQIIFYIQGKECIDLSPGLEREINSIHFDSNKKVIAIYNALNSISEGEHEVPMLTGAEMASLHAAVISDYYGSVRAEILPSVPGSGRITGRYAYNDEKNGLIAFVDPEKAGSGLDRVMTLHKTAGFDHHFEVLNDVANQVTEDYFERFKASKDSFAAMATAKRDAAFFRDNALSPMLSGS